MQTFDGDGRVHALAAVFVVKLDRVAAAVHRLTAANSQRRLAAVNAAAAAVLHTRHRHRYTTIYTRAHQTKHAHSYKYCRELKKLQT